MKISVIGAGYVGLVTGAALSELGHEVTVMDINAERIEKLGRCIIPIHEPGLDRLVEKNMDAERLFFTTDLEEAVRESHIHFICVGTPQGADGSADLSVVFLVAKQLAELFVRFRAKNPIVVTKSTVPVGTGAHIKKIIADIFPDECLVVSNPEFLREGQAVADMMHPDRIVIGSDSAEAAETVASLYAKITSPIIKTTLRSSELIKYAANTMLATKLSFAYELGNVCDVLGADIAVVAEGIGFDKRIGKAFLKPAPGFGGSCLPKDVNALYYFAKKAGYDFLMLKTVLEVNEAQRKVVVAKIHELAGSVKGKKIYVLGLAFKSGTDDVRDSPSLEIIRRLAADGAKVKAFDPVAMLNAKAELGELVTLVSNPVEGARDADILVILTEWPEFKELDWRTIKSLMTAPKLMDARNILDPQTMIDMGFAYKDLGRANSIGK